MESAETKTHSGKHPKFQLQVQQEDISLIEPYLYLGAKGVSEDQDALARLGITFIVNCTKKVPNHWADEGVRYLQVPVVDDPESGSEIATWFDRASAFIEEARGARSKVLVHCTMGMSRSSTVVIAYLMKYHGMGLAAAIAHTKERRPVASPNTGFMRQLIEYEQALYGRSTVSLERYQADRFGDVSMFRTDQGLEEDECKK